MTCASEVAPGVSPRPWLSVRRERGTPTPGNLAGVHQGGGPAEGPAAAPSFPGARLSAGPWRGSRLSGKDPAHLKGRKAHEVFFAGSDVF